MHGELEKLFESAVLTETEAKNALTHITEGSYNDSQITAFLATFLIRPITVEELRGFRNALLAVCEKVDLKKYRPMDLCGTGGDGKNTFNISTLSALVVASLGVPVAKHGNYGVSSVSGSSNVLEYHKVFFPNTPQEAEEQLIASNLCFLHAPKFHPAMKAVASIRKQLGVKTFFNMLGPLVNPAEPTIQCTGVFHQSLGRLYHYLLQTESNQYSVLHDYNGYDEISLTASVKVFSNNGEKVLNPSDFLTKKVKSEDIFGGKDLASSAAIFLQVLKGKGTEAQNNVVIANSALALQTYHNHLTLAECLGLTKEALLTQKAYKVFQTLKS
ncbi:MAG: anthranilate phosphoribosyltransferase [Crocinitomicaceae bacterium]|nr:anthranilate phosphoribosyltransferase [Crocinitomicaceae bacterium]